MSPAVAVLGCLLLLGLVGPAVGQARAFELVADSGGSLDPAPLLMADAGILAERSAPIPFRLLPEGASIGVLDEHTWSGEFPDDRSRSGYSLLPPSEDSSGSHHRSADPRRLDVDGLIRLAELTSNQRSNQSPATGPDWPGIARDSVLFVAAQAVSVAVLYALPADVNLWQDTQVSLEDWWHNVSRPPVWDGDAFGTNYISHPYWGATYYIRARERGFGKFASFGYSLFLSTLYEYGAEALFERPSGQDLMVTPILGSLIGAFVFEPVRDWVKRKPEFQWYDQVILIATDPLGLLSSVVERVVGIKSEILLRPSPPPSAGRVPGSIERGRSGPRPQGFSVSFNVAWE